MPKHLAQKAIQTSRVAVLLLLVFSAGPTAALTASPGVAPAAAAAKGSPYSYTIQLTVTDPNVLTAVGDHIQQRFTFAHDPKLANVFTFSSALSLESLRAQLSGRYLYIEPVTSLHLATPVQINDPGYTTDLASVDRQWGLAKAGFTEAWNKTRGSPNITVAVVDTGIDETHEDLARGNYVAGYDFLKNLDIFSNTNSDDNGHGTLVAGVIAATPNNGLGIAGAIWQAKLMPLKALDASGSGNSADIAEAIAWAADHGADIVNLSLGGIGFGHDTTLANAISAAYTKGAVIIAAAGNDVATSGSNLDSEPVFPICDDNGDNMVIGVAATDENDRKPEFSNFGKSCIDVSAPGRRILSTINFDPVSHARTANGYAYASGTSLAVPFVAAEAVLIKAQSPQATNRQIRDRIIATADNIDAQNLTQSHGQSCQGLLGAGRINAQRALAEVISPPAVSEGDLAQITGASEVYYISGGRRHLLIPFVKNQRFATNAVKQVSAADVQQYPIGGLAEPLDGTLVQSTADPTVYYMAKGFKQPVTYQVFRNRQFKFSDVARLLPTEVGGWLTGSFFTPPDGTLMRGLRNPTVYWVVGDTLHPINHGFFVDRGLNIFPIVIVPDNDLKSFSQGEAYIR